MMKNINSNSSFYFNHSYCEKVHDTNCVILKTKYENDFVSMIEKDNIIGLQFHPEKSQIIGEEFLKIFMKNSVLILIIMINSRIIAVIYVIDNKVVLSRNFGNYSFIGSIDIVVSYMNKWEVDEIIILDIKNSIYKKDHLLKILKKISQLCQTPLSVGGGINNLKQISKIINSGVE